jgi:hypothetical protein
MSAAVLGTMWGAARGLGLRVVGRGTGAETPCPYCGDQIGRAGRHTCAEPACRIARVFDPERNRPAQ